MVAVHRINHFIRTEVHRVVAVLAFTFEFLQEMDMDALCIQVVQAQYAKLNLQSLLSIPRESLEVTHPVGFFLTSHHLSLIRE